MVESDMESLSADGLIELCAGIIYGKAAYDVRPNVVLMSKTSLYPFRAQSRDQNWLVQARRGRREGRANEEKSIALNDEACRATTSDSDGLACQNYHSLQHCNSDYSVRTYAPMHLRSLPSEQG